MKKFLFMALGVIALSACNSKPSFQIEGKVTDAEGKTLYLEAAALEGILPLDSAKLSANGTFSFKQERPESPEFYRLRMEDKVINLAIDSTETVKVTAALNDFATGYSVEGSANCTRIKELSLKQLELHQAVNEVIKAIQARSLTPDAGQEKLNSLIKEYKDEVKSKYIFAAPNTTAAYFALFQQLGANPLFDAFNNKEDVKCFAAVATSLNNDYPHAIRSKNLYNIVIKGMKNTRQPQQQPMEIDAAKISEAGVIEIALRDMKGNTHKLTELNGKAVILDFTVYQSAVSAAHNYLLRDLYDKYHAQGLEIYQVSLDADEHYWKTTADNLPWICVRDANGIYSPYVSSYNVQSVPTLFLINKNNELKARSENIKDLEAAVKALL